MDRYLFIALTLGLTTYSQLMLKARALLHASGANLGRLRYLGTTLTDVFVLSRLAAAVVAALCWMLAVERTDISLAYPFMAPFIGRDSFEAYALSWLSRGRAVDDGMVLLKHGSSSRAVH